MATTRYPLDIASALPVPGVAFAEFKQAGTSLTVDTLSFDATTTEGCMWKIPYFPAYGVSNPNITVKVRWYADSATADSVVFGAAIAAVTPNTDTQDAETKTFDTEATAVDTHLGTTGQRWHDVDITITALNSVTTGDIVWIRLQRLPANGSDTMAGDVQVTAVVLEYSDT